MCRRNFRSDKSKEFLRSPKMRKLSFIAKKIKWIEDQQPTNPADARFVLQN